MINSEWMNAQVLTSFGPAKEAFVIQKVPVPAVGDHEMLIEVHASSVNPVDIKIRSGLYKMSAPDHPAILHSDVAGRVVSKGAAVSRFKVGDEVYGCAGGFKGAAGAIAEYMLVDADLMAHKPKTLSATESASLPLVAITAWLALIDRANIKKDHKVLIHAASGGVGSFALQLALWKKAHTFTTASTNEKGAFAKKKGATVINYRTSSVEDYIKEHTRGVGFDVVFDTVGGENINSSTQALAINGQLCEIGACPPTDLAPLFRLGASVHFVFMPTPIMDPTRTSERRHYGEILTKVAELIDTGNITPLIGHTLKFSELAKAHELLETQQGIGKICLTQDLNTLSC